MSRQKGAQMSAQPLQTNNCRKRVVVVDRDDAVLHLCAYLILQSGMSPYTCWSPEHAFTVLSNVAVHLVVTDLEFPTHNGIDLTHFIRTNYPPTHVIAMTTFGDVDGAVRAVRAGATDYLRKPFSPDEFLEKLAAWTEERGPFSGYARSEQDGRPECRTFISNSEIASSIVKKGCALNQNAANGMERRPSRHEAIIADAVRTLRQIIKRDIEETALFAAVGEEELRAAYLASPDREESDLFCPSCSHIPSGKARHL
jgi:DNA-binding response OmpR family regulator